MLKLTFFYLELVELSWAKARVSVRAGQEQLDRDEQQLDLLIRIVHCSINRLFITSGAYRRETLAYAYCTYLLHPATSLHMRSHRRLHPISHPLHDIEIYSCCWSLIDSIFALVSFPPCLLCRCLHRLRLRLRLGLSYSTHLPSPPI